MPPGDIGVSQLTHKFLIYVLNLGLCDKGKIYLLSDDEGNQVEHRDHRHNPERVSGAKRSH